MDQNSGEFPKGIEVVTGVFIQRPDGKFLLTRSPNWSNKWVFCGGHIEPGETIFQAAEREALEETGMNVRAVKVLQTYEFINPADFKRKGHFIAIHVVAQTEQSDPELDNNELTEFAWVTPSEALEYDIADSYIESLKLMEQS